MLLLITLSSVQTLETQIYVCNKWTDEQIQQQNKQYKEKNLKTKGRKKKQSSQCHVNTAMWVWKVSFSSNLKTKIDSCLCYNFLRKMGIQSLNSVSNFGK